MRAALFVVVVIAVSSTNLRAEDPAQRAKDAITVRALLRLPGINLDSKPEAKAALLRHLQTIRGTEPYLDIVEKFKLRESADELLRLAIEQSENTLGVKAAGLLLKFDERPRITKAIADPDSTNGARLITALGLLADAKVNDLVSPLITGDKSPLAVRAAAVTALGRNAPGQKWLLELVQHGKLPSDLTFAAANALLSSQDQVLRAEALKHLSLPAGAGGQPLPSVADLVKRRGDPTRGKELFTKTAICSNCHKVGEEGKEVGPDLSEIGSKLSSEALYLSILDPNAGISFNYETWVIRTLDGTVHSGILVSQTDDTIELKTANAIVHKLAKADVDEIKKTAVSLMPGEIQKQLSAQDLVDIVEYLATLKKPN